MAWVEAMRCRALTVAAFAAALCTAIGCAAPNASDPAPAEVSLTALADAPMTLSDVSIDSEPWSFGGAEGFILRTPHYRVFTTEESPVLRERVPRFLELALEHYRGAAVAGEPLPAPPMRLDTYLMDNRAQWEGVTRRLLGTRATPTLAIGRGGYATRGIGVYWDIGLYDTLAVAAHEGWHQYTQRTFGDPLPTWLEEGMATYMEGHRWVDGSPRLMPWANIQRYDRLRTAHAAGELRSVRELLDLRPSSITGDLDALLTYYAQVWALVHYLEQGANGRYKPGLERMLRDAAAGVFVETLIDRGLTQGEALRIVQARRTAGLLLVYILDPIDESPEAFEAGYASFVDRLVRIGGRDAIVQGRSPLGD
jgi:hypothetical protein